MDTAHDFTVRLRDLLRREHVAMAELLVGLADFDAKRLWVELGYASLFDFLHRELGLSKGAAFYRKTAVELIRRCPEIVEPLRDGRLCLMTVAEVARVLTPANRDEVLPRFFHLSKREAKALAAELDPDPAPPRREVVTPLRPAAARALSPIAPAARPMDSGVLPVEPAGAVPAPRPALVESPAPALPQSPVKHPSRVEPLTAELARLGVTVSRSFLDKLEAARAALSHSRPGASTEEILEAGLDLVLERAAKRKGLVENPRREPPPSSPDNVPAHVRRAVWERDGGRCQWPVASGGVCGSTVRVELDHVIAKARGGPPSVENLRCLCRIHNDLAARQVYGDAWMDRFTRGARGRGGAPSRGAAPPP